MLEGGIELEVELIDQHRAMVRLQHGDVQAECKAAWLSVPYPSGLDRLRANEPDVDLVVVDRASPGLQKVVEASGISYLDLDGRGRVVAPGLVYIASPRLDLGKVVFCLDRLRSRRRRAVSFACC